MEELTIVTLAPGLIDIHCHLLAGLDDGPPTVELSQRMCGVAHASGTVALISTPHANYRFQFDPAKTSETCAQLRRRITLPLQLFTGCELQMSLETLASLNGDLASYTLNGSRYLLLELMPAGVPPNLDGVLTKFLEQGVTPVLAHPERSPHLHRHPEMLVAWVERGCLTQLTGDSLLGRLGSRVQAAAVELLRRRLVHFVASDGHDPVRRPPRLLEAYRAACAGLSPAVAERLFVSNPRAVLEDGPIQAWPAY